MLSRLFAETRMHQGMVDADALDVARAGYAAYLVKRYGFEAPLESALAVAPGVAQVIDLQARQQSLMLVEDLVELGLPLARVLEIPHADVRAFRDVRDALGWLYVSDRSAAAHDRIVQKLPRCTIHWRRDAVGARDAIGRALDALASDEQSEDRIIDAAIRGFEHQHRWLRTAAHVEPVAAAWMALR